MKKIYIFLFAFIFLTSFVSAQATITDMPDVYMTYSDYHSINVDSYASNHDPNMTYITFTNPDSGATVTLFPFSGEHTNTYFSIRLTNLDLIEIYSFSNELSNHDISVWVGNDYQTQDGTTFDLFIQPGTTPQQIATIAPVNLTGTEGTTLRMSDFFSNFDTITINYSDNYTMQTVELTREFGQNPIVYFGVFRSLLSPTGGEIYYEIRGQNRSFNDYIGITASNDAGSVSTGFNLVTDYDTQYGYQRENVTISDVNGSLIDNNGTNFVSAKYQDGGEVTVFDINMNPIMSFDIGSNIYGISMYDGTIYVRTTSDRVRQYFPDGTLNRTITATLSNNQVGLYVNSSSIVIRTNQKYNTFDHTGTELEEKTLGSFGDYITQGLDGNGTAYFVTNVDKEVVVWQVDGSDNNEYWIGDLYALTNPQGVAMDITNSTKVWVTDVNGDINYIFLSGTGNATRQENKPLQIASIAPINITYNQDYVINIHDFFINWDNVTVTNTNGDFELYASAFQSTEDDYDSDNYYISLFNLDIDWTPLYIQSKENIVSDVIIISVHNIDGTTTATVPLEIFRQISDPLEDGTVNTLVDILNSIFPDPGDLSLRTRIAYAIVSMIVIFFVVFIVGLMATVPIKYTILLAIGMQVLLLIYMISIGYVPITVLVVGIVLLVALIYLRNRGGG